MGIEELRDEFSRQPRQPVPRGVLAELADRQVEPELDCGGIGLGVGEVGEDEPAFVAKIAKEHLRPKVGHGSTDKTNGNSVSSSGRTAPGSKSIAFGPARSVIRLEQTCGMPSAGKWQIMETRP